MEHKPQSLRVRAVERLLGKLRQEGRLVVKPVVTHPPKLPYKRHNPNETGLKRYELKGGRYLIRSKEPRRNRKCKNLNCEHSRQNKDDEPHGEALDACDDKRSTESEPVTSGIEFSDYNNNTIAPEAITTSSVTFITATVGSPSLLTNSGVKSCTTERSLELASTTCSLGSGSNHNCNQHRSMNQNQHSEDDGQALFFRTDHSMFYLSSLEDGFLTEEITEQI